MTVSDMEGRKLSARVFEWILIIFMTLFGITVLYPFVFLLALSFNQGLDALKGGITIWPRRFTLENYTIIFQDPRLLHAVFVSVARTALGTVLAVLITGYVSFCFTKKRMVGYRLYMTLLIVPMYVNAGIIPTYLTYRALGLTNTFLVYIIPNLVWAYNILIMRTFFEALPQALEESAMIDGASEFVVFFRIIFPLSMPVVATIGLFNAVWHWNTWFDTILLTRKTSLETLMSFLAKMLLEQQSNLISDLRNARRVRFLTPTVLRAAMTIITTLPIVLVYPFLQKYFVRGVLIGGVKG
jgi:putative aldouronate transport system permease protein